ncbi:hypothetical protein BDR26DRAFT_854133 [Obelidium mucronatum]|nr:hypothetical protein BDR26DRAFT_854133 [Obelidium mucronatum]
MWTSTNSLPLIDPTPVELSNADIEFLDALIDNGCFRQGNSNTTSLMTNHDLDPFASFGCFDCPCKYFSPATAATDNSLSNGMRFDMAMEMAFSGFVPNQPTHGFMFPGDTSNIDAQWSAMLSTAVASPFYQSPQLSYPLANFYSSPMSVNTTPSLHSFQQGLSSNSVQQPSPAGSVLAGVTQPSPLIRQAQRAPIVPRRSASSNMQAKSQSAARSSRTQSTPSFAPYTKPVRGSAAVNAAVPTAPVSPPARMTPSLLMAESNTDANARMTPSRLMNLVPMIITSSPLSAGSPSSPVMKFEASVLTPQSIFAGSRPSSACSMTAETSSRKGVDHSQKPPAANISKANPSSASSSKGSTRTLEERRQYRKQAEKQRRELIKTSFDQVKQILPRNSFTEKLPSKEKVLDVATDYILDLMREEDEKVKTISALEYEINSLKAHFTFSAMMACV